MCTNTLQAEHAVAPARIGLPSLLAGIQRNQEGVGHRNKVGGTWSNSPQMHSILESVKRFLGGNQTEIASALMRLRFQLPPSTRLGLRPPNWYSLVLLETSWSILRHLPTLTFHSHDQLSQVPKKPRLLAQILRFGHQMQPRRKKTVAPCRIFGIFWSNITKCCCQGNTQTNPFLAEECCCDHAALGRKHFIPAAGTWHTPMMFIFWTLCSWLLGFFIKLSCNIFVYIGALAAMTVFAWRVATHRLSMLSLVRSQSPLPTRLTVCP